MRDALLSMVRRVGAHVVVAETEIPYDNGTPVESPQQHTHRVRKRPPRMIRKTRELLAAFGAMNRQIPGVCLAILDESLSVERQVEFGALLVELGEAVQAHARTERAEVVEGEAGQGPGDDSDTQR